MEPTAAPPITRSIKARDVVHIGLAVALYVATLAALQEAVTAFQASPVTVALHSERHVFTLGIGIVVGLCALITLVLEATRWLATRRRRSTLAPHAWLGATALLVPTEWLLLDGIHTWEDTRRLVIGTALALALAAVVPAVALTRILARRAKQARP